MDVTVHEWANEVLGRFALVKVGTAACGTPASAVSLESGLAARPPLNLALVLDVSGSMRNHMPAVVRTALGAVDVLADGASLRVITFDQEALEILPRTRLDTSNREGIKDTLRTRIVNRDGMTNIEHALVMAFSERNQSVLLMTDGLANVGMARTSDQLTTLVRAFPAYDGSVVHALGVQHDEVTALNANFLKAIATDTSGSFSVAADAEALGAFLGDVIADHAMRSHERMSVRCILSDGSEAEPVLARPLHGHCVRHDRPTSIVFRLPPPHAAAATSGAADGGAGVGALVLAVESILLNAVVAATRASAPEGGRGFGVYTAAETPRAMPPSENDIAAIVGWAVTDMMTAASSSVLGLADRARARNTALDAIKGLVPTHASLAPIVVALEAAAAAPALARAGETGALVRQAATLFSACSNLPDDTPAMVTARHLTRAISSRQDPYGGSCHDDGTSGHLVGGGGGGGGTHTFGAGLPPLRPSLALSPSVAMRAAPPGAEPALPGSSTDAATLSQSPVSPSAADAAASGDAPPARTASAWPHGASTGGKA